MRLCVRLSNTVIWLLLQNLLNSHFFLYFQLIAFHQTLTKSRTLSVVRNTKSVSKTAAERSTASTLVVLRIRDGIQMSTTVMLSFLPQKPFGGYFQYYSLTSPDQLKCSFEQTDLLPDGSAYYGIDLNFEG